MQINGVPGGLVAQLASVQSLTDVSAPASAAAAPSPASKGSPPLFSNGLVNYSSLMTPGTLSAIFALNADGTVKTDPQGTPQMAASHKGAYNAAESLLADHVRAQADQKLDVGANLTSAVTDLQKQFFHDTTGYNLVVEGTSLGVYDNSGKLVPEKAANSDQLTPEWQLAMSLQSNEMAGGTPVTIDANWLTKWTADYAASGGKVPGSWAANAQKHIDGVLDAMMDSQSKSPPSEANV